MENYFATKKPDGWFWSGQRTREQVVSDLSGNRLQRAWLICPFGEAKYAVTVGEFVDDPEIIRRLKEQEGERRKAEREIAATIEKPRLYRAGGILIIVCLICMVKGRILVAIFFRRWLAPALHPRF
ncbi:MAG: hypothetical protein HY289_08395 [Planctomycetes bacterium]|nr:hypothetical protein [Planctomycetota bacterium]